MSSAGPPVQTGCGETGAKGWRGAWGTQPARTAGWVSLGKCEPVAACSFLKGRYKGDGAKLFLAVADTITRDSVHRLQLGRFRLDMRETFFPRRMVQL